MIFDILHVFASIQGEEGFDITGIAQANWPLLAIVTAVGALLFFLFGWLASRVPADSPVKLKGLFRALPFVGVAAAAVFDGCLSFRPFRAGSCPPTVGSR